MQIQKREAPLKTKFFLSMSSLTTSVTDLLLLINMCIRDSLRINQRELIRQLLQHMHLSLIHI